MDARFRLHLGSGLVRLFGGEDAKVFVVLKIGAVKAIQARHLGAGDFVKHAALAKDAAHAGGQSGVQHLGLAAQHNGNLHLVDVVHANAGGVVGAGKAGKELCQAGNFYGLLRDDVLLAQGDNLLADVDAVPLLKIGQHVLAHQLRQVFPHPEEMGVNGTAVILLAVHREKQGLFRVCLRYVFK